jgi:hypothetical protein
MNRGPGFFLSILLACFICVSPCCASDGNPCEDPCGKPTAWQEFNVFELKVTKPNTPDYDSWRGRFDKDSGDAQIAVQTFSDGKMIAGNILLIGGRVMATRGPITKPGSEIDALDAAVLQQQLVVRLLGEVVPEGPARIQSSRKIDFRNEKTGIEFATPSAQGFIAPPWHVSGDIAVASSGVVEYELTLRSGTAGKPIGQGGAYAANFSGQLSKVASAKIDDTMSLSGWSLFGLGVQTRKEGTTAMYDYGAVPAVAAYKNVADVRKKIAQDDYPGEPDPSKDFTGFWKENCDDAFGLQIMPHGTEGKYSVVFCGPGGCGNPDSEGDTFISKDRNYEVISENEIKTRGADRWDTYRKCTKDTHPILKYKEP